MLAKIKEDTSGFTLVEVIIAMVILTVGALATTNFLISIQYSAEDNLYASKALTFALNALEQMKATPTSDLEDLEQSADNAVFTLTVAADETVDLNLGEENKDLPVPTVTNGRGIPQTIPITLTPSITKLADATGFWLRIEYEYAHPRNGRLRSNVLGCVRSKVPQG